MGSSDPGPDFYTQQEETKELEIDKEAKRKNRQLQQNQLDQLNRQRGGGGGVSPASGGSNQTLGG
jgi:hypothetical protein